MKVHKMSTKQFAKFVMGIQKQAMKNPLHRAYKFTDKYDYQYFQCDPETLIDCKIRRRLGGTADFNDIWAMHDIERRAWIVREGDKLYEYLDSDIEKAVQKDG